MTKTLKLVPLALAVVVVVPTAAPAAIPDPQSDAAMRKAIRGYAEDAVKAKTGKSAKVTRLKVDCVQAEEIARRARPPARSG